MLPFQGFYSKGNATKCTECPKGYECSRVDISEPVPCQAGSFSTGGKVVSCLFDGLLSHTFSCEIIKKK